MHDFLIHPRSYEGEEGYIRLQVALVEHSADETVAYNSVTSMLSVFRRAGLPIPS